MKPVTDKGGEESRVTRDYPSPAYSLSSPPPPPPPPPPHQRSEVKWKLNTSFEKKGLSPSPWSVSEHWTGFFFFFFFFFFWYKGKATGHGFLKPQPELLSSGGTRLAAAITERSFDAVFSVSFVCLGPGRLFLVCGGGGCMEDMRLPMVKAMVGAGCSTSQQHADVSQGLIYSNNCTCCHTVIEVTDQAVYLTLSQYTDTGPTSLSADHKTPGAWQGGHWSANF